jgi:hypothetical protein
MHVGGIFRMRKLFGSFAMLLALTLAPCAALADDGAPLEGVFAVNFTSTPSSPGLFDITANGIGILSNVGSASFQLQKTFDTTLKVPTFYGTFTMTALNGDTLTGTYAAVVGWGSAPDSIGNGAFSGQLTLTGGTGRYQGATGTVSFSALANGKTGQAVYSFKGVMHTQ